MEILISCLLGLWISLSAFICLKYYKNDEKRGEQ